MYVYEECSCMFHCVGIECVCYPSIIKCYCGVLCIYGDIRACPSSSSSDVFRKQLASFIISRMRCLSACCFLCEFYSVYSVSELRK